MTAGDSYLDGAFDVALTLHVTEINVVTLVRGEEFAEIGACWQKCNFAAQEGERLPQILHPVDVDFVDHCSFERICFGYKQGALAAPSCFEGNGQHAFYRTNRTVECQFADKTKIFECRTIELLCHSDHSKRNR